MEPALLAATVKEQVVDTVPKRIKALKFGISLGTFPVLHIP